VYKCRIRIKEFFTDFDKLRSGFISQAQVRRGGRLFSCRVPTLFTVGSRILGDVLRNSFSSARLLIDCFCIFVEAIVAYVS